MTVCLVGPDAEEWCRMFSKEREGVLSVLGANCHAIHHIGSTSLPDMPAKPVIDMLVEVRELKHITEDALKTLGYRPARHWGLKGLPFRSFFSRRIERSDGVLSGYNIHIYPSGYSGVERHLTFRDYMRGNAGARREYLKVKEKLAEKYRDNVVEYAKQKSSFIDEIMNKCGYEKLELFTCFTPEEWEEYHKIRIDELFSTSTTVYDYNHVSLTHPEFYHFVFKKGVKIIGIMTLEIPDAEKVAIMRSIAIVRSEQGNGYGIKLVELTERLCWTYDITKIILHARLSASHFYRKLGFIETTFNEPAEKRLLQIAPGGDWEKTINAASLKTFEEICDFRSDKSEIA